MFEEEARDVLALNAVVNGDPKIPVTTGDLLVRVVAVLDAKLEYREGEVEASSLQDGTVEKSASLINRDIKFMYIKHG